MEQPTVPEAQPMSARYQISERDYLRGRALAERYMRPVQWVGTFLAWACITMFMSTDGGWMPDVGTWVGGVVGGVVGCLALELLVRPWELRRRYRRYKVLHDEQVISLLDNGVHLTSSSGESRLAWNKIFKWRCNADYVLIYLVPRLFCMVPTRIAEQGFDVQRLKAALTQHVGPAK